MSRWKQFRYRLEAWACRALAAGIPRLSRRSCVRLANGLGALAYTIDGRGRAVALANLKCVFGDRYTERERQRITQSSYRNFVRTMFDLFWVTRLDANNYQRWIRIEGADPVLERMAREKRGAVFVCTHEGNWEWANLGGGFRGVYPMTVAENFKNPLLTELFKDLREHSGATMIPQESSLIRMLKVVKRAGPTSLLIDLNLPPTQAATVIDGFTNAHGEGLKMCVPILHAVLAQRGGALLVPVETEPQADGSCRVILHEPVEFPDGTTLQAMAQRCWNVFEPIIRRRPDLYLWPYKHFRYRPKSASREYPFYSNESGKFEKLLRSPV